MDLSADSMRRQPRGRHAYYVPADSYVEGHGFRISLVFEGEAGHFPSGTWPYEGEPGQKQPWFADTDDHGRAREIVREMNASLGLDAKEAAIIVGRSMARQPDRRGR